MTQPHSGKPPPTLSSTKSDAVKNYPRQATSGGYSPNEYRRSCIEEPVPSPPKQSVIASELLHLGFSRGSVAIVFAILVIAQRLFSAPDNFIVSAELLTSALQRGSNHLGAHSANLIFALRSLSKAFRPFSSH